MCIYIYIYIVYGLMSCCCADSATLQDAGLSFSIALLANLGNEYIPIYIYIYIYTYT